jgi:hypothetical protein
VTRARIQAAAQAAFFVAGIVLLPIGVAAIYRPAGLISAGLVLILAGAYVRGGRR